jgi:hypothetical protein
MLGNRWHSPWIRWYPDVMSPWVRRLARLPRRFEAADQRQTEYESGVRVWDTNCLRAFRRLRHLTAG